MKTEQKQLATASMVCGIVGLVFSCIILGAIPAIVGLVMAIICLVKKRQGKPFAITGLITSIIAIIFAIIMIVYLFIFSYFDKFYDQLDYQEKSNITFSNNTKPKDKSIGDNYETDLIAGYYTAGIDIPSGTYNVIAISGTGNVSTPNEFNHGINEIMQTPVEDGRIDNFHGLQMDDGMVLSITGNLTLHLVSKNASLNTMNTREASKTQAIDLVSGNFVCGTDFPPGNYNVVSTSSDPGTVFAEMAGGYSIIESMSNPIQDDSSISQFNNATFHQGDTIDISHTSVKLVPAGN